MGKNLISNPSENTIVPLSRKNVSNFLIGLFFLAHTKNHNILNLGTLCDTPALRAHQIALDTPAGGTQQCRNPWLGATHIENQQLGAPHIADKSQTGHVTIFINVFFSCTFWKYIFFLFWHTIIL